MAALYRNPVLNADWPDPDPDPDAMRVGETYFLVASSGHRTPGLPVLCSPDLLHWEPVARVLSALPPAAHFNLPRHGAGVRAPALRHHVGLF